MLMFSEILEIVFSDEKYLKFWRKFFIQMGYISQQAYLYDLAGTKCQLCIFWSEDRFKSIYILGEKMVVKVVSEYLPYKRI